MDTAELNGLTVQIDNLLLSMQHLKSENNALRNKLATAARDRQRLQEANQQATAKVKKIVQQLKEEMS